MKNNTLVLNGIVIILCLFLVSCRSSLVYHQPGWVPDDESTYKRTTEKWTRTGQEIKRLITVIDVSAVYRSWDVRVSYVDMLVNRQGLSAVHENDLLEVQREYFLAHNEFIISAYCGDEEWLEFQGLHPLR